MTTSSPDYVKKDAQTLEWTVTISADGEKVVDLHHDPAEVERRSRLAPGASPAPGASSLRRQHAIEDVLQRNRRLRVRRGPAPGLVAHHDRVLRLRVGHLDDPALRVPGQVPVRVLRRARPLVRLLRGSPSGSARAPRSSARRPAPPRAARARSRPCPRRSIVSGLRALEQIRPIQDPGGDETPIGTCAVFGRVSFAAAQSSSSGSRLDRRNQRGLAARRLDHVDVPGGGDPHVEQHVALDALADQGARVLSGSCPCRTSSRSRAPG